MAFLQTLVDAWPLLPVGLAAGVLAGLFGVGGGLVVVPTLFYFLQFQGLPAEHAMPIAVSTSLCAIVPTSVSSALSHWRLGNLDRLVIRLWLPTLLVGVFVGAFLISTLQSEKFAMVFGAMLLLVASHKLVARKHERTELVVHPVPHVLASSFIGFVSVIAGVGGGATGVPVLTYLGLPIHRAIGCCALFGFFISLPGALFILCFSEPLVGASPGYFKQVYWIALVLLLPTMVAMAPLGAWLGKRFQAKTLNRLFVFLLFVIGSRMFISGLGISS